MDTDSRGPDDAELDSDMGEENGEASARERSSIAFPYLPLDDAIPVARALYSQGGGSGTISQVAAWMGHDTIQSGAFRTKMAAARLFGLIHVARNSASLSPLGRQMVDPAAEEAARVRAFLSVPLYRKTFEKYDGYPLPPDTGLEAEFVRLGVSEKQKSRARQVFQRSAKQAGFFANGKQRLVLPKIKEQPTQPTPDAKDPSGDSTITERTLTTIRSRTPHPLIAALFETVPEEGAPWDFDAREKWLSTAKSIFDLVYRD